MEAVTLGSYATRRARERRSAASLRLTAFLVESVFFL
jgi:hypothetical protein